MSEDKAQRVLKTAWPWRDAAKVAAPASGAAGRGLVQTAIMLGIAAALLFLLHRNILPLVIVCVAGVNLVLALAMPNVFVGIERFWKRAAHAVGVAVTWALLTPFFYLCFLPGRFLLLAVGRDPMRRRFPSAEPTCWKTRKTAAADEARYKKQF